MQRGNKREMFYKSKEIKGSFTIEAAYIMPIILFTVIALIYFILYLYNVTLFESRMNEAALSLEEFTLQAGNPYTKSIDYELLLKRDITYRFMGPEEGSKRYITEYVNKQNKEGYVFAHVENIQLSGSILEQTLSAELVMDISLPEIFKVFSSNTAKTGIAVSRSMIPREEKQRIYTVLKDTVMQIKGIKEILEKIESVIDRFK